MALTLEEIKKKHDKGYTSGQTTRERAADDMVFMFVTQWDSAWATNNQEYEGQFDLLRKAYRDTLADLEENPIQNDFEPKDSSREDAADLADGMYRSDISDNASIEAIANAESECVTCGFGEWEIYTEYETSRGQSNHQVIKRKPNWEANNNSFWDPNAKMLDRSDARWHSKLTAYSEEGYKGLVEELTGEEAEEITTESFAQPEQSFVFPWIGGEGEKIYVTTFHQIETVKDAHLTMENPLGETIVLLKSKLSDVEDDMIDEGYEVIDEKEIEREEVTRYICSGREILNGEMVDGERVGEVIAGENIPVIPMWGECAWIEGEFHYEGITRLAKDAQRLRNYAMSYLQTILSQSPREKPIFFKEQIQGYEEMYDQSGDSNNYALLLQNMKDGAGNDLPIGPVGTLPAPSIPPALIPTIDLTRQSVEDVANPGLPGEISDTDISGTAMQILQSKLSKQTVIFQQHKKHAIRRDAEVYISIASEINDVPRTRKIEMPDGTRKEVQMMETIIDNESGEVVTLNDISNLEFDVYSTIGVSYGNQKEKTREQVKELLNGLNPADPTYKILLLKYLNMTDGTEFDDVRDYAKRELLLMGIRKPETPEEEMMVQQAQQQPQEPSAEMLIGQAEMLKGQAANKEADIKAFNAQSTAQSNEAKNMISGFEAQTKRMQAQIDALEANATVNMTNIESFGKQLDNQGKVVELQKPKPLEEMHEDELYEAFS